MKSFILVLLFIVPLFAQQRTLFTYDTTTTFDSDYHGIRKDSTAPTNGYWPVVDTSYLIKTYALNIAKAIYGHTIEAWIWLDSSLKNNPPTEVMNIITISSPIDSIENQSLELNQTGTQMIRLSSTIWQGNEIPHPIFHRISWPKGTSSTFPSLFDSKWHYVCADIKYGDKHTISFYLDDKMLNQMVCDSADTVWGWDAGGVGGLHYRVGYSTTYLMTNYKWFRGRIAGCKVSYNTQSPSYYYNYFMSFADSIGFKQNIETIAKTCFQTLKVSPNPFRTSTEITFGLPTHITIFNVLGQNVITTSADRFRFAPPSAGTYIIRAESQGNIFTKMILMEK